MNRVGFSPALVVETSPRKFQSWLKHPEKLDKEMGTAAARALAEQFGGDVGAADWRRYGRLSGFTNRKERHRDGATGLYPFVKLVEAGGAVIRKRLGSSMKFAKQIENRHCQERERRAFHASVHAPRVSGMKSIDAFRANPRYGGEGTRSIWHMRFTRSHTGTRRP